MTKNIYKYAIILGVLFSGIAATARATTFIEGFEDVPLMDGMTQIQKDTDRKSTRLNSSHSAKSRMPSSA